MSFALNPGQRKAVGVDTGFWRVDAAAGAGKTRVIVERFCRLVRDGISPNDILSLTFTRAAALEMAARAENMLGCAPLKRSFSTFHSFALRVLLSERDRLPFHIVEPVPAVRECRTALRKVARKFPALNEREARSYIALKRRAGTSPSCAMATAKDFVEMSFAEIYAAYDARCRERGWLDFDLIMAEAVKLLESDSAVRGRWQFLIVQADEAQDQDGVQWRLLQLISEKHRNVLAVGDINQSLYGWRGAEPGNLMDFERLFPGARTLTLPTNYRSTPEIVAYCREIAPLRTELVERMRAATEESGSEPQAEGFNDDRDEADWIVSQAVFPDTCAVLARTNRQLRPIEDACLRRGVRYRLLGKSGFWQRPEILDLVAFCRIVENPLDDAAFKRILLSGYPCAKYLGRAVLDRLLRPYLPNLRDFPRGVDEFRRKALIRLHDFLAELRATALSAAEASVAVEEIIDASEMAAYYGAEGGEDGDNFALENLAEATVAAARFKTLAEFVAHARRAEQAAKSAQGITLSTVHSAKGKEWGTVFIAGCCDGLMPHRRGEIDEERRIFYVACTRAQRRLVVCWHGAPSPLIPEDRVPEEDFEEVAP